MRRITPRSSRMAVFFATCFIAISSVLHAQRLSVTFQPSEITTGEVGQIAITYENINPGNQIVRLPPIAGIEFLNRTPSTSQQHSISGGQRTFSLTYSYNIRVAQPGTYTIPGLSQRVGRSQLVSQPAVLTVVKQDPELLNKSAYIKLNVPKNTFYVGEVVPIDVQLFVTAAENIQYPQINNEGFTISKPVQGKSQQRVQGNRRFNVYRFYMTATAVKSGTLTLGPVKCQLTLLFRDNRRRRDFFDSIFNNYVKKEETVLSKAETIKVLPLPEDGVPAGFNNAIGQFNWAIQPPSTEVTVGDPITLNIKITGRGNLESIELPTPESFREFQVYEPKSTFTPENDLRYSGSKSFEQVIIPQHAEISEIPEFNFSFFDPEAGAYRTLRRPATPLKVKAAQDGAYQPAVLATGPLVAAEPSQKKEEEGLAHIKARIGTITSPNPILIRQGWFIGIQAVPFLGFLGALAWRLRSEHRDRNPHLIRQQKANAAVKANLANLQSLAKSADTEAFYATLFRALQGRIGQMLDLPLSSITAESIDQRLSPAGLEPELVDRTRRLFEICDQARYAPIQGAEELTALSLEAQSVIEALGKAKLDS